MRQALWGSPQFQQRGGGAVERVHCWPGGLSCRVASLAALDPSEVNVRTKEARSGREAERNHQGARQHVFRFNSTTEVSLSGQILHGTIGFLTS